MLQYPHKKGCSIVMRFNSHETYTKKDASADMTCRLIGIGAETIMMLGNPSVQSLLCND